MIRDCPFSENVSKRYLKSNHLSMLQLELKQQLNWDKV